MKHIASDILLNNFKSTFTSCSKDQELIWKKLLVDSKPYSDRLKRLLVINTPDCLDTTQQQYKMKIDSMSIKNLKDGQYIRSVPKLTFGEHEEVKSYLLLEFDNFTQSANPEYKDCTITITIVCHLDYWEMNDYNLRPWMIAGYVDGILNGSRLSGIGKLNFLSANQIILNEYLGGVMLRYYATHSSADDDEHVDDSLPANTELM